MTLSLDNRTMRRLWLSTNGLLTSASGPIDVVAIIQKLGFVQLDTIRNVSRAHHHILWSRHQGYREPMLDELLSAQEHLFEHFTHDASVLPMSMYPMWRERMRRLREKIDRSSWHNPDQVEEWREILLDRIRDEGPLSTKDFDSKVKHKKVWSRPPHKRVLDYLWYAGILATSHRESFLKFYDLRERVIPEEHQTEDLTVQEQVDWLCRAALDRLGVGTPNEIKAFWDAAEASEVKAWVERNGDDVIPVEWKADDGRMVRSHALRGIEDRVEALSSPSSRMRIINPFDPAVRDRKRLKAIFGFDYKLEVFVPEAKREWGYYVYPLLEGDGFVGRLEAKADRKSGTLRVLNFWPEPGVRWGKGRRQRLDSELKRFGRLADLKTVVWV